MRRITAIILSLLILLTAFPVGIFADELLPEASAGSSLSDPEQPAKTATAKSGDNTLAVKVVFELHPADLVLNVYSKAETENKDLAEVEPIAAEEDGTYLLLPGEYLYTAEADGYIPVTEEFTLIATAETIVSVTLAPVAKEEPDEISIALGDPEPVEETIAVPIAPEPKVEAREYSFELAAATKPQYLQNIDMPDPATLAEHYIGAYLYLAEPSENAARQTLKNIKQQTARANLNEASKYLYDACDKYIGKIAAGSLSNTALELDAVEDLNWSWTPAELGVSTLASDGSITSETYDAVVEKIGVIDNLYDVGLAVFHALLADNPYELYWFDKTEGVNWGISDLSAHVPKDQSRIYVSGTVYYSFTVSEEYRTSLNSEYSFNTAWASSIQTAVRNAKSIVSKYASSSDYDKVCAYKKEICDLVYYNHPAAEEGPTYGGSYTMNPWQLVWVFDGNPDTNVVCEGYSKAFQYLCDLSSFRSPLVRAISVSGWMVKPTDYVDVSRGGNHMWNVIRMDDGNNYLVDITNCDAASPGYRYDSIGYPDALFLVGTDDVNRGSIIYVDGFALEYIYDSGNRFSYDELTLCKNKNYTPSSEMNRNSPVMINGASLTLEGQITINFFVQVPDGVPAKYAVLHYANTDNRGKVFQLNHSASYYDSKRDEYKLSYPNIPAKEMTVPVILCVYDNNDILLRVEHYKAGALLPEKGIYCYEYCVADWARNILGDSSKAAKTRMLAQALLNYGHYAQKYFRFNEKNLANTREYLKDETEAVSARPANDAVIPKNAEKAIGYTGASLILEGATSVRLYFTQKVEAKNAAGKAYTLQQSGKEWYVEIPNIASKDLDQKYVVIVTKDGVDYRFEYSALSYANGRLTNAKAKTDIKNLCKALYLYNDAANKYFAK